MLNLKANQDPKEFENWLETVDMPFVRALPSVKSFDILRSQELFRSNKKPPYQYVEIIKLSSLKEFSEDYAKNAAQEVAMKFREFSEEPLLLISKSIESVM